MDEFNNNNNEHNNNDTHNNNNNNNNNNTDKVVGVLGGMGPNATVDFLQLVVRHTVPYAQHDQDHVRMVVHHNPRIPNRQRAILLHKKNIRSNNNNNNNINCNKSMSYGPNNNDDENNNNNNTDDENNNNNNNENNDDIIGRMLMDMVRCLVRYDGVDFIVMPCNLGHVWEKDIVKAAILQTCTQTVQHACTSDNDGNLNNDHNKDCHCDNDNDNADNNNNTTTVIPFISMIDVTVEAAIAKCRTIGDDDDDASESHDKRTRKIGLLTTPGCFHAGLYQTAFDRALANRRNRNHHRNCDGHNDDDQQQQQQQEEDDDDDDDIVLILQSEEELDRTMELVYRIKCGDTSSSVVVDGMIRLTRALVDRGAQVVIAACTEIPLVLKNSTSSSSIWNDNNDDGNNNINVPLISSTEELAKRTVALALGHDI